MTSPPAADPESKLRPRRSGIAIALTALIVLALIASSILNYVYLDTIPGRASLYGLLAVALITLGTFILVRAFERDRALRRKHLIRAAVLIGLAVLLELLVTAVCLVTSLAFMAGILEELAKGLAVLLLFLIMRNEFDDVVDGIVYGAAVGLGFNFLESISYMTNLYSVFSAEGIGWVAAGIQWYGRQ